MLAAGDRGGIKTKVVVRVHSRWGETNKAGSDVESAMESDVTERLGFADQMIRKDTSVFEAFGLRPAR